MLSMCCFDTHIVQMNKNHQPANENISMRRAHRFKKPCDSIATDVTSQHHHEGTQKMKNIMVVFATALVPSTLSKCLGSLGRPTYTAKPMCLRVCASTRLQAEMD